ncbi:MAG TPA: Dam family site-specific DNA-(adenine-N6)-methyltransferase [Methanofastidiosum sp.]|nr:Dam family site-specific DNA-(adenine-N6)-methyltransferase [Methanofastidiosum sp.]HQK62598.1 Dam family site-specific DNA-(adenine-N6)-methyltransferase [Methanofastidiosum sp.]
MNDNLKNPLKSKDNTVLAKPFLKWAGGKSQLIPELSSRLPKDITNSGKIDTYVEPFVGGGAFFFYLKSKFEIKNSYLFDINRELVVGYKTIQNNYKELILLLQEIESEYLQKDEDGRKKYYYNIREKYNKQIQNFDYSNYNNKWIERASYLIFLNRTCFNGLFRQNSKGEFNVPCGKYKNPTICDKNNLKKVNSALQNTEIIYGDFSESSKYIIKNSLVYFDPPYRPLTTTSSFTSYSKEDFGEEDQIRLANYFKELGKRGAYLILSNSDPKNENPNDEFFDNLFKDFVIERVNAKRSINCDPKKRGEIKELIIRNY